MMQLLSEKMSSIDELIGYAREELARECDCFAAFALTLWSLCFAGLPGLYYPFHKALHTGTFKKSANKRESSTMLFLWPWSTTFTLLSSLSTRFIS